ncbi:MAG: helix-turn-helix transcriptional regulator [Bacilli bacterium]|nr:helix-turn-helix transcriptional regulator [Bacilli bacterium]
MEELELKGLLSSNLIKYRKANNLTQANVAEALNYSDKAISKWERGESLPDLYTLSQLAALYNITVNDLIMKDTKVIVKPKKNNKMHFIVTSLSFILVWLVATIVYVIPLIFTEVPNLWLIFISAIPVSFIVLLVFSALWGNNKTNFLCVTGLVLSIILAICMPLYVIFSLNKIWLLFILFAPLELLNIFWFLVKK